MYKRQIFDYAPSSNGADDYRELVKEFLGRKMCIRDSYNTLDRNINGEPNKDHRLDSRNASQTSYSICKYMKPLTLYSDINNTGLDMIVFRYAEILLSKAEAMIEKNTDLSDVYKRQGLPFSSNSRLNSKSAIFSFFS